MTKKSTDSKQIVSSADASSADASAKTSVAPQRLAAAFSGKAWQQVLARDARGDGKFVYAVRSTGVYCRPSCASRKPERRNVSFFATADEAEEAGFRACLRCDPRAAGAAQDPHAAAVEAAAQHLRLDNTVRLTELSHTAGLSRSVLVKAFVRVLGVTPGAFARTVRSEELRKQLRKPKTDVTTAIHAAGYGSTSRVYEAADGPLGMTPTAMRSGGEGETIHFAVGEAKALELGSVLAASTARGLCAVFFAESAAEAELELRERFPRAVLRREDAKLSDALRVVLTSLEEPARAAAMPFDVRATAFQRRVWTALREIPRGETRTYAEIAEAIGSPKSARAVGAACGANPLAIAVPCHRVVGADGALTGYRWGQERKLQLLAMEGAAVAQRWVERKAQESED